MITKKDEDGYKKYIVLGVFAFIFLILLFMALYTIPAGFRGVLLTFGKPSMISIQEGLHAKIPLAQSIVKMDTRIQKYEAELTAASKDLQDVKTKIAINYRIVQESAPEIYRSIGINYAEKVIYPFEQEINKATTAQYTAEELITKRDKVRENMKASLIDKLRERGIIVEEISIINFEFSPSFTQAIEQKVTAEQNALAAKNKLEQVKYEADQRIAQAQGEAEALRLQKQQISLELIQLKQVEVQSKSLDIQAKALEKWNGIMPTTLITGQQSNSVFPFYQINK